MPLPYHAGKAFLAKTISSIIHKKIEENPSIKIYAETWVASGWVISLEFDYLAGNPDYKYYQITPVIQFNRKDHANQGSCIFNSGEDAGLTFRNTDGNGFGFYNGTTNALRIKPDGKIGINCTPDYLFIVVSDSNDMCRFQQTTNNDATSYSLIFMKHAAATSGANGVDITFENSGGTTVGMIDHGQSTTQYRTSSDYRLKENAEAI